MKPASVLEEIGPAALVARTLQRLVTKPPVLSWSGQVQPIPMHRSRVVFGRSHTRTYAHNEDADNVFRGELRLLWTAAGLGRRRPLEGDLAAVFTFAGSSWNPRSRRHDRRRPDETNLAKAVEDAGNPDPRGGWRGLWLDDAQIVLEVGWISAWGRDVAPLVTLDVWRLG